MNPAQEKKLDSLLAGMQVMLQNLGVVERDSPDDPERKNGQPGRYVSDGTQPKAIFVPDNPLGDAPGIEALYQAFKARLVAEVLEDPKVLALIASKPELQVTVRREVISVDDSTLPGKLAKLLSEGFFREPKKPSAVTAELKARGAGDQININMGRALQKLNEQGFLRREGSTSDTTYVEVPGMLVNVKSA